MSALDVKPFKLSIKSFMEFGICSLEAGEKRLGVAVLKTQKLHVVL
jgi:hypothetical protein